MFVCFECCVLSGRGLCDGLITHPEESYRLWRLVVCDQETSRMRRLKPATGLWKIQPHRVVTPRKQTNNKLKAVTKCLGQDQDHRLRREWCGQPGRQSPRGDKAGGIMKYLQRRNILSSRSLNYWNNTKRNLINNMTFKKFIISVWAGHYGYSPWAPKIELRHWSGLLSSEATVWGRISPTGRTDPTPVSHSGTRISQEKNDTQATPWRYFTPAEDPGVTRATYSFDPFRPLFTYRAYRHYITKTDVEISTS